MEHMPSNVEIPKRYFGDSSQLTNWILDSGETCHMTPEISDFLPGSLVEMEKYIEVADGNFFTQKQTGGVQIKIRNGNGKYCTSILYNVLFTTYLCDWLFFIIMLMNLRHTYLFIKGFAYFYLLLTNRTQ